MRETAGQTISDARRLQIFEESAIVVGAIRRRANEYAKENRVQDEMAMMVLEVGINRIATDLGGR